MDNVSYTAVKLIKNYFGEAMSIEYGKFYQTQTTETIKESIAELLIEYLGEEQAFKKLKENQLA